MEKDKTKIKKLINHEEVAYSSDEKLTDNENRDSLAMPRTKTDIDLANNENNDQIHEEDKVAAGEEDLNGSQKVMAKKETEFYFEQEQEEAEPEIDQTRIEIMRKRISMGIVDLKHTLAKTSKRGGNKSKK